MTLRLTDHTPEEIAQELALKTFQGRQLFRWLHQKKVFDFDAMSDISKSLRGRLKEDCVPVQLQVAHASASPNSGTRKLLFRLSDGETVESVLIRDRVRTTLCLSTQVGCAVKCAFCATGLSGYTRNLTAGEIIEQALFLLAEENLEGRSPNIVFMGMGEPFRNYDAVTRSIRLLMHPDGLGIGARRITVSTAGEVEGIRRFAAEDWQVRLSVSLHAANDALRTKLVPLNKRYPLAVLREAIQDYLAETDRQVTLEWTLLQGVNDSLKDAEELLQFMAGMDASVNLIPFNPVSGTAFAPPARDRAEAFQNALTKRGIKATLRKEKGRDINAACGQLRRQVLETTP